MSPWSTEHTIETSAKPEAIWRLWEDVDSWPSWNSDIEQIESSGPFAVGSTITMTPRGQEPITLKIADVAAPDRFVDEADLGDIVVRTIHQAERLEDGRTRITYRMEISGSGADTTGAELGAQISADFPDVLASLVEKAEQ
jgi:hypothetical protein